MRESGQPGCWGMALAGSVSSKTRSAAVGASFKSDLDVRHPGEEVLLAFGKQFKLRPASRAGQIAWPIVRKLCEALRKETIAIAGDFENAIRR